MSAWNRRAGAGVGAAGRGRGGTAGGGEEVLVVYISSMSCMRTHVLWCEDARCVATSRRWSGSACRICEEYEDTVVLVVYVNSMRT